jgi:hypothetical protein
MAFLKSFLLAFSLSFSLVATAKSERITKAHIARHQIAVSLSAH